jgi:4'-phosphopantetheinyl transferase
MITVYLTSYELQPDKKKQKLEHEIGLLLLQKGLKEQFSLSLEEEEIQECMKIGEHGKPYLCDYENIHFNISHCKGLVACALSEESIGVDVELIQEFKDSLPKRVLSEEEQEFLMKHQADEAQYREQFFRFWTLKESYIKWDGRGFFKEPRDISFELDLSKDPIGITFSDKEGIYKGGLGFYQEKIKDKYFLTVCSKQLSEHKNIHIFKEDF